MIIFGRMLAISKLEAQHGMSDIDYHNSFGISLHSRSLVNYRYDMDYFGMFIIVLYSIVYIVTIFHGW